MGLSFNPLHAVSERMKCIITLFYHCKNTKKNTAKSGLLAAIWSQKGTTFSWPERTQNHNNPKNPQNGPKGPPGVSKMTNNHDSDIPKSRKSTAKLLKNCTVAGYARSALDRILG